MTSVFHARPHGRFIKIKSNLRLKKLHRTNQGFNFIGDSFSNRDNVRAPIQFLRGRQPQHLKYDFSSKQTYQLFWSNETSLVFPALKSTSCFLLQYTVSCRSDSSSEANFSCWHKSDAYSHLR